jgi:multidrug resistance efflux pump
LRLLSSRTIEVSADLVLGGGTLVIAIEPGDPKADRAANQANLIAITPSQLDPGLNAASKSLTATSPTGSSEEQLAQAQDKYEFVQRLMKKGYVAQGEADAARAALERAKFNLLALRQSQLPESSDVEALRKLVTELQAEVRMLRGLSPTGKTAPPPSNSRIEVMDPEQELLRLDVKEAEVNYAAAKADFDDAQQMANRSAISRAELAARKLALDKSEIALQRIKVRLNAAARPADARNNDRDPSGKAPGFPAQLPGESAEATRALRELDVREAELDLAAARTAYDEAAQLHAKGVLGAAELAARKLAVQKAEIAVARAKVRFDAFRQKPADSKNQ